MIDDEPSEIPVHEDMKKNMMIHIEGDEGLNLDDDDEVLGGGGVGQETTETADKQHDRNARKFLEDLMKVGPFAKQILNYSYPPLLY
jgi:hypothetical protein